VANTQFETYQRQYTDTLTHIVDRNKAFLMDAVTIDTDFTGKSKTFKFIGQLSGQKKTSRNEIATLSEPDYSARILSVDTHYCATAVDAEDIIKMVNNPMSDIYQEVAQAIRDIQTQELMESFFADVVVGESGGSTSSFPSANQIAVDFSTGIYGQNSGASNVGLNMDKLFKAKSLLADGKVRLGTTPETAIQIAICEDDLQQLLATKIGTDNFPGIDSNFGALNRGFEKASQSMEESKFYWNGIHFHLIPKEYFLLDGSGHRRLPVWVKNGHLFGIHTNLETQIVALPNSVESTKVQALTRIGGMRKHDKKVYEIKVAV